MRQLCKGNVAVVKGAVAAGCRAYYGYPITPASEIAEAAALYLPQVGGTFLQAESEVAAINMVYGASSAGVRAMTGSSGPGLSLMQEGLSYMAGSELPAVVAGERAEPLPLSFAQQRMGFLEQMMPGTALYHVPLAARLPRR